jgi:ABC-2 type transport system ATP-binding protein
LLAKRGKAVLFSSPVLEQVEKMCSHLVVLNRGGVVASGPIGEMQAGFAGNSLEAGFMQLTEQVDIGQIAGELAAAVLAPTR